MTMAPPAAPMPPQEQPSAPATTAHRAPPRRRIPALLKARKALVPRLMYRAPIVLYRMGLGWMLGHQFLLLTHAGRKTGRVHETVLKVLRYDPRTGENVV